MFLMWRRKRQSPGAFLTAKPVLLTSRLPLQGLYSTGFTWKSVFLTCHWNKVSPLLQLQSPFIHSLSNPTDEDVGYSMDINNSNNKQQNHTELTGENLFSIIATWVALGLLGLWLPCIEYGIITPLVWVGARWGFRSPPTNDKCSMYEIISIAFVRVRVEISNCIVLRL